MSMIPAEDLPAACVFTINIGSTMKVTICFHLPVRTEQQTFDIVTQ